MGIIRPNQNRTRRMGDVGPAKNVRVTPVDENLPFGTYVWQMPDGKRIADDQGRYLCMEGTRDDIVAMAKMRDAALAFADDFPEVLEGRPVFLPGRRQQSDEEHAEDKARFQSGEILDHDLGAIAESQKQREQWGE